MTMVRSLSKRIVGLVSILGICSLSGCYYTAQSYNNGKLLDPGNSMFTVGVGRTVQTSQEIDGSEYVFNSNSDTTYEKNLWKNIALNYQLGITDLYPFGGGLEIGLLAEVLYNSTSLGIDARTMPALDFDLRAGFKDHVVGKSLYQHNLELGWTTGMWLDNGFFLGYAGGWEFEKIIPYGGIRAIIMPTNLVAHSDWYDDDDFYKKHDQRFNLRLTTGITLKLKKMIILPDYISPEFTLTGPNGSEFEPINGNFHVGFRWTNGI